MSPGDEVIIRLKNELAGQDQANQAAPHMHHQNNDDDAKRPCTGALVMSPVSTNLHFHGLTIPPACHEDDDMKTSLQPGDAPFEYRFRIPQDEPPGLYWYHPTTCSACLTSTTTS